MDGPVARPAVVVDALLTAADRAVRAELVWRVDDRLAAAAVLPLVVDGRVVLALPFSMTAVARSLRAATAVSFVLSDSRMARRGWSALAAAVRIEVAADRAGEWTWTGALDQEVRKDAVSRRLVDTPLQRREHWWFVPRWVVRLTPTGPAAGISRRGGPDDGVLVEADGSTLRVTTVAVDDWAARTIELTPLASRPSAWLTGPADPAVASLLFTHDFSIPDMERGAAAHRWGARVGRELTVSRRSGTPALEPVGGVVRRVARHRALGRDCRRALAAYDASSPAAT